MTYDALKQLERLAVRRREALRKVDEQIAEVIVAGRSQRLSMARMAEAVGLSRQGLYDLMARANRNAEGKQP